MSDEEFENTTIKKLVSLLEQKAEFHKRNNG